MMLGMFDFWWEFCFLISEIFFKLIELVSTSCNKIAGIDTITINGEDTTLFEFLFSSKEVYIAFAVAVVLGMIFTLFFAVIQIIINFSKDKTEETPITIFKKAVKNIFIALCVPTFMLMFFALGNAVVRAMYQATSVANTSISQFMFSVFAQDAIKEGYDSSIFVNTVHWYDSFDHIEQYIEISDFDFMYSYIIGAIVMWALFSTALMLVERVLSLIMLYIASPFVIASSVVDDGVRFKNWRDQVLVKFFTGFGAIIGINVYLLVVKLVTSESIVFFKEGTLIFPALVLNQFMKLVFIAGGAVCMKQAQAIVGNLISQGAGDKAIAENERSNSALRSGSFLNPLTSPFRAVRGIANFGRDAYNYGLTSTVAKGLGFKNNYDYARDFGLRQNGSKAAAEAQMSGNYNGNKPNMTGTTMLNNAVNSGSPSGNNGNAGNNDNQFKNDSRVGKNMVNNVIANAANLNNNDIK